MAPMFRVVAGVVGTALAVALSTQAQLPEIDKVGARWVDETFKKLSLDDKIGQLIVSSVNSTYLSSDSDVFETLTKKVKTLKVGGFHVFGGTEPIPNVLLNTAYGSVSLS